MFFSASPFRGVFGVSLAMMLGAPAALAEPEEPLLDPGVAAAGDVMEMQAAGPPEAEGWSEGALEATRTSLSTTTSDGSAIGHVKIDGGRYNLYQENAPVNHSTYTPPPYYP